MVYDVLWPIFRNVGKVRRIDDNFVFTRRGKPIKSIRKGFVNACRKAGIENFRLHDLRHTYNTNMRKAGVDQTIIMKLSVRKTQAMFKKLDAFLAAQKPAESSDNVQTGS